MATVKFLWGPMDGLQMAFPDGEEPAEVEFRIPCLVDNGYRFAQYACGPDQNHTLINYITTSEPQKVSPQFCFDCEAVGWPDGKGRWAEVAGKKLRYWTVIEELTGGF